MVQSVKIHSPGLVISLRLIPVIICCLLYSDVSAQQTRWSIAGKQGINWTVRDGDAPHLDHVEMSGKQVSVIVRYGTGYREKLMLSSQIVFPMLRTIPNDTHASLLWDADSVTGRSLYLNGHPVTETAVLFNFDGILNITSSLSNGVMVSHHIFPSTEKAAVVDKSRITNNGLSKVTLKIPQQDNIDTTRAENGVYGRYILTTVTYGAGTYDLAPGESMEYAIVYSGRKASEPPYYFSASYEYQKRRSLVRDISANLVLETPDPIINKMFDFAKLRVTESIYDTKNGLMHGPGGGAYYAAVWANDEAEYANPFFPFLGNAEGIESAANSFRLFAEYMNKDYKPIPSSIIAEGTDIWDGAGDRGDQAMIAYGASRFSLAYADTIEAKRLWPLIAWCLEYLRRKKTSEGVIPSDADELEGRFPAGKVNLSTNTLTYGALISSSDLAYALRDSSTGNSLLREASVLRKDIEKYFGGMVQGFQTYKYYKENTTLRSWIGLPLTMGIFDRKEGTLRALYSPYLWTKDGMLTESGSKTYWDRTLLYALRGTFYAGATDSAAKYLHSYSEKRLLGEHVPYAIEAWPEGNQRHLSAESGLYCRVITEGLFGIRVTGFNKFEFNPRLPAGWDSMSLKKIHILQRNFDMEVSRRDSRYQIKITEANGKMQELTWDGLQPITIIFN